MVLPHLVQRLEHDELRVVVFDDHLEYHVVLGQGGERVAERLAAEEEQSGGEDLNLERIERVVLLSY